MKEEKLAHEARARRDGQTVGDAVERALPRFLGAEERDGRDGDPSDAEAGCEEQQEDERRHRPAPLRFWRLTALKRVTSAPLPPRPRRTPAGSGRRGP